jgi:hypothetical protein
VNSVSGQEYYRVYYLDVLTIPLNTYGDVMKPALLSLALLLSACSPLFARKYEVKVIGRKDTDTDYSYAMPGHSSSQSKGNANCNASFYTVNCS